MTVDAELFVIGAGPAGLTAAYCMSKETPSVIVVEKDPGYVGGISRTVHYKNFLFDIGGHRFFSKAKEVVDLWKEILPDDFIERPRLSRIPSATRRPLPSKTRKRFTTGSAISSARNYFPFSSRPTLKKYGACHAMKYRQTGHPSASKGSILASPS